MNGPQKNLLTEAQVTTHILDTDVVPVSLAKDLSVAQNQDGTVEYRTASFNIKVYTSKETRSTVLRTPNSFAVKSENTGTNVAEEGITVKPPEALHHFIIQSPPAQNTFLLHLQASGVEIEKRDEKVAPVVFKRDGAPVLHYLKPIVQDSQGKQTVYQFKYNKQASQIEVPQLPEDKSKFPLLLIFPVSLRGWYSKGIDSYAYVAANQPADVFHTDGLSDATFADGFGHVNQQLDSGNISGYTGEYKWTNGSFSFLNNISTFTGNLQDGSQMTYQMSMPALYTSNSAVSYGFYDSGPGATALTNQDQCYVYVTPLMDSWMGDFVKSNNSGSQPFRIFALPGAHDAGMNTTSTYMPANVMGPLVTRLSAAFPSLAGDLTSTAPQIIMNSSITQKDTFTDMLNLGCRFFDFRPGYMVAGIPVPNLYHQHTFVPGARYLDFLTEILQWLVKHPTEIIVVNLNTQGFAMSSIMSPSQSDLDNDWNTANAGVNITSGDPTSLQQSYNDLIAKNIRVIFLNQLSFGPVASKYDSYDNSYNTTDPTTIINKLGTMTTAAQGNSDYTILQLQGTASGAPRVTPFGWVSSSWTASCLMSTKGKFDFNIQPWVIANAAKNLTAPQLMVLLNDFIDNATTATAITVSSQRLSAALAK